MVGDSDSSDETTFCHDGLLKVRFANRSNSPRHLLCISSALRTAEFQQPVFPAGVFTHTIDKLTFRLTAESDRLPAHEMDNAALVPLVFYRIFGRPRRR